jgi:anaerobic ribonucleoside-triphosphate reductase activating protein
MNYLDITTCSVADGDGFRLVLWTSGCSHHCEGCHNAQSWDENGGQEFTEETMQHLLDELKYDYIKGLTLSGGDPLYENNIGTVYKICEKVKEIYPNKKIWLYTGYKFETICDNFGSVQTDDFTIEKYLRHSILQYIDVLVDGQYVHQQRDITLAFRGSSNQRLIDVQETLKKQEIVIYKQ